MKGALALLDAALPDAAVLDFDLNGETSEPVAEALSRANRSFIVTTGYEPHHLGPYARRGQLLDKPIDEDALRKALGELFSS
jgi:hypothetical protein